MPSISPTLELVSGYRDRPRTLGGFLRNVLGYVLGRYAGLSGCQTKEIRLVNLENSSGLFFVTAVRAVLRALAPAL